VPKKTVEQKRGKERQRKLVRVNKDIENFFALPAEKRESLNQEWTHAARTGKIESKFQQQ
jgi:hypothetical protein